MPSMKTKKPMKPMSEMSISPTMPRLSSANHHPRSWPSQPIHRGSARVVSMATADSGTTTPRPRKLPAALVTRGYGREGVGSGRQRCLASGVDVDVAGTSS